MSVVFILGLEGQKKVRGVEQGGTNVDEGLRITSSHEWPQNEEKIELHMAQVRIQNDLKP